MTSQKIIRYDENSQKAFFSRKPTPTPNNGAGGNAITPTPTPLPNRILRAYNGTFFTGNSGTKFLDSSTAGLADELQLTIAGISVGGSTIGKVFDVGEGPANWVVVPSLNFRDDGYGLASINYVDHINTIIEDNFGNIGLSFATEALGLGQERPLAILQSPLNQSGTSFSMKIAVNESGPDAAATTYLLEVYQETSGFWSGFLMIKDVLFGSTYSESEQDIYDWLDGTLSIEDLGSTVTWSGPIVPAS